MILKKISSYFNGILFVSVFLTSIFADDNSYVNIDWSQVPLTTDSNVQTESVYEQLRNYESTCFCDLTRYKCDISCCCDVDCTSELKRSFSCLNQRTLEKLFFTPNVTNPILLFLNNFLQVHTEITPYLGEFFSHREIVRNVLSYGETAAKENTTVRTLGQLETLDSSVYKIGTAVKVVNDQGKNEYLFLAQNSGPGTSCSLNSPVRFGVNERSNCVRMIDEKICQNGSLLDAKLYVGFLDGFSVLSSPGGNGTEIRVSIRYNCNRTNSFTVDVTQTSSTSEIVFLLTNSTGGGISFDEPPVICKSFSPVYDPSTQFCRNIAQQIDYQFYWKSEEITALVINVHLMDVPMTAEIIQNIQVAWSYDGSSGKEDIDLRYGYYILGSRIWATSLTSPKTNSSNNFLSTTSPSPLQILKATVVGSCESSQLVDGSFGVNSEGSCFVSLSRSQFKDCAMIRENVVRFFQPVLKFGYLLKHLKINSTSTTNLDNLVEILKDIPAPANSDTPFPSPGRFPQERFSWPTVCHFVPAHLRITIQYVEITNGSSFYEIIGSLVAFENVTWMYKTPNDLSSFLLTNRILFTKVPSNIQPQIKFYVNNDSPSCLNAPSLSVCWNELFYAFMEDEFTRDDDVNSLVVGLTFILVVIATFLVTKPWW